MVHEFRAAFGSRHVAAQTRERVSNGAEHLGIVVGYEHTRVGHAIHCSTKGAVLPMWSPLETGHEGPSTRGRVLAPVAEARDTVESIRSGREVPR
jgi:hypothetical protein